MRDGNNLYYFCPLNNDTFDITGTFQVARDKLSFSKFVSAISVCFTLLSPFLDVQISSRRSALGFPHWAKNPSEPRLCRAPSSTSLSSQLAWACVVWLVRPLWFRSDPRSMSCGGGVSEASQTVLWGWYVPAWGNKILSAKPLMFSKSTDPECDSHAKPVLPQFLP